LVATAGTYYIHILIKNYQSSHTEVYIAWFLLCGVNTYNLYTLYYDALLQGKGLVKKSKQIVIFSQLVYLAMAIVLLLAGYNLIAIVAAQGASVFVARWLSRRLFFTPEIKQLIAKASAGLRREVLQAIYPNALKIGLTTIGGILTQRSAIIIGSLYLPLGEIASFGITMQIITLIAAAAGIYTSTYQAKIVHLRIKNEEALIKTIYVKGQYLVVITYIVAGCCLIFFKDQALNVIGSKTQLLPASMILLALLLSFEQTNFTLAGNMLLTKNEVPFFKASIASGIAIVIGLLVAFHFFNAGVAAMLLVPLLVDACYQTWKWPLEIAKDLKLKFFGIKAG